MPPQPTRAPRKCAIWTNYQSAHNTVTSRGGTPVRKRNTQNVWGRWGVGISLTLLGALASSTPAPPTLRLLERAQTALIEGRLQESEASLEALGVGTPVRVSIDLSGMPPEHRAGAWVGYLSALNMWEDASHGLVRWHLSTPEQAQVRMSFVSTAQYEHRHVAGRATWSRAVQRLGDSYFATLRADIAIGLTDPTGAPLSLPAIRHVMAHELGHVIGLDDSPMSGSIMGRLDPQEPAHALSPHDEAELTSLHTVVRDVQTALLVARRTSQ